MSAETDRTDAALSEPIAVTLHNVFDQRDARYGAPAREGAARIIARAAADFDGYGSVDVLLLANFTGVWVTAESAGTATTGGARGQLDASDVRRSVVLQDALVNAFGTVLGAQFHRRPTRSEEVATRRQQQLTNELIRVLDEISPPLSDWVRAAIDVFTLRHGVGERIKRAVGNAEAGLTSRDSIHTGLQVIAAEEAAALRTIDGDKEADAFFARVVPSDPSFSWNERALRAIDALRDAPE